MGLGLFMLGGAMEGYGKGKMDSLQIEAQRRRDEALAKLEMQRDEARADRDDKQIKNQYNFMDRNNANAEARRLNADTIIGGQRAEAATDAEWREEQRLYRVESFKTKLKLIEDRARAGIENAYKNGDVEDILETEGGVTMLMRGGKTRFVPMKLTPKATSGGRSLLDEAGGAGPAPAPTARPAASAKTMTMEDIQETAKAEGITPTMAKTLLERRGFTLQQ